MARTLFTRRRYRGCVVVFGAIVIIFMGLHLPAGPPFYTAPAFSARVIDEQTQKPIEGVTVLAVWWVEGGLLHPRTKVVHVEEAMTDVDGKFKIDGWWPRPRPFLYRAEKAAPLITLHKAGYHVGRRSNRRSAESWRLRSFWSGKTVSLSRHANDPAKLKETREWMRRRLADVQRDTSRACCPLMSEAIGTDRRGVQP